MRYWVCAQTPLGAPADRPRFVRSWVHYRDSSGGTWGCRLTVEVEALADPREALGWLDFFAAEAPPLNPDQRIELFAGPRLVLVCDILSLSPEPSR